MGAAESEPTLESRVIYQGRIMTVRVDKVRLPNGRVTTREIAEHDDSVCVVPVDSQGNVVLVRQYRKPVERVLLEAPAGGINPGEAPEATVLRELQEETGFKATTVRHLSSFWLAPGWCTERMHAYLATGLAPSRLEADDDENITVELVPLSRIPELIASGEIQDAKSIAALLLAMRALESG
ncbi:MAG: NUDIX hydrolase [Dehalococcoidia bacterium]|nr:NUDIX hydrolase [Dehalococcoidia bacterium]MSQ16620.1 NUDIX hydrolase [Dehalococcoidia bacterium]